MSFADKRMNVLVIAAHPDDETIGCGGTLAKLSEAGHQVRILLALKRNDPRGVKHWDELLASFCAASEMLGAKGVLSSDLVSERLAETEVHRVHDAILPHVDWADMVFSHWTSDAHQAHRGLSRAVEIATRPFRRHKEVYLFETSTSTDQGYEPSFTPNCYSILNRNHVSKKSRAMALYTTETIAGRTPASLRRKAQTRGAEVNVPFAEAFRLMRHFI